MAYNHPYEPYDIQVQLMDKIYETIDNGYKVGIFESPTGTGKTLSLICSTMSWLRNHKRTTNSTILAEDQESESDSEPEWVQKSYKESILSRNTSKLKDYEHHLSEMAKEYDSKLVRIHEINTKKTRRGPVENDYLPPDYIDIELQKDHLKDEINMLLNKVSGTEIVTIEPSENIKIYFSSRTHSQLNQMTHQLELPKFESSLDDIVERTKYLALGSRKQLCINPKVSRLSNLDSINDACKESVAHSECEYFSGSKNSQVSQQFRDYSLTKIHDIEDLNQLGQHLKVCPYYSIRNTVKVSEIISLPYQMLLEPNTREILNVDLKNSIIIIDEAHNLLDTITSMNSVKISLGELSRLLKGLQIYFNKFMKRLNSGNRINLMKLIKVVKLVIQFIQYCENSGTIKPGIEININDMFSGNTGDLFNIHNLEKYLSKSKIAFKIENYLESSMDGYKSSNPLLFKLIKFLKALSHPSSEGKFFWDTTDCPPERDYSLPNNSLNGNTSNGNTSINYMLLDPSQIFKPIIENCKCLLLCGGTMEPITDYTDYLFSYLDPKLINKFSCNHIIPDENLKVIPISSYNGGVFDFTYQNRNNPLVIKNLGQTLFNLFQQVPYGLVVFFPSYKYLNEIIKIWKSDTTYTKLETIKRIFIEPKSSHDVDSVLQDYSTTITKHKAAALFSVVGGKLSEGINFSDDLARGIIMIGLPYPNLMSGELIAKRKYIESKSGVAKSKEYIENICMRSINQSIGRSIRHINDYSMIYLIDQRYGYEGIQGKLSNWIRNRIIRGLNFDQVMDETREFFIGKCWT